MPPQMRFTKARQQRKARGSYRGLRCFSSLGDHSVGLGQLGGHLTTSSLAEVAACLPDDEQTGSKRGFAF